ncbi:MAG: sulfotransferase [bacterium]
MIPFDFPLFCRVISRSFRLRMIPGLLAFIALEIFNGICLLLDELLFPGYRRVKLTAPVFIIGNPRSGTTHLHRTLSRDTGRFFVFKTWEILFPSVLQKRIGSFLGRVDAAIGSPLRRVIERAERRILGTFRELHPTGLFHAEEDEMLFLHCFATLYLVFFFPMPGTFLRFADFDGGVEPEQRERLMRYYVSCLKRQAYARGREKCFLSKNPFFSGKMATLHATFPDARFVYLVRNPLEAIPSTISEGHASCIHARRDAAPPVEFQELVYEVAKIFYQHPLAYLAGHADCVCPVVRYPDLVGKPRDTIAGLYDRMGWTVTDDFLAVLEEEQSKAGAYRSGHHYSLDAFVIPGHRIVTELADVFDRFEFPRRLADVR